MKNARKTHRMVGIGALTVAIALFGTVVVRAFIGAPAEASSAGASLALDPVPEGPATVTFRLPEEYVRRAVAAAPFQPDRAPELVRYRLPDDPSLFEPQLELPEREVAPPPAFQLLGTAASDDGGLAIIRIESGTPRVVSVGDQVSGYRVDSIDAGRVVMAGPDLMLSLSVASPASAPPAAQQGARRSQPQRPNQPNARPGAQQGGANNANTQAAARMQEVAAAAARLQNASPEQRAVLLQEIQQRLGQGGAVQFDGNRVIIQQSGEQGAGGDVPGYRFAVPVQPPR